MIDADELKEFEGAFLTGITVGTGSQLLIFQSGASILVQCAYACGTSGHMVSTGHGEVAGTASLLFVFLNRRVECAALERDETLVLRFDEGGFIQIFPERNGLESYVVTTRFGISPVLIA